MATDTSFIIAERWKQLQCPSTDKGIHPHSGILFSNKKGMKH
jgi:hypothetical protein